MRFFSHTDDDITAMLKVSGFSTLEELFSTVPNRCRRQNDLDLPEPYTEWDLSDYIISLFDKNATFPDYKVFIGAGSYNHMIPASISYLLGRSEFSTSYTPYQPELSQGTLQGLFEYQTLTARLLGMEIANASLYDGASALAEALLMSIRITGKKKVAISLSVHPNYRRVVSTYLSASDCEVVYLPFNERGRTEFTSADLANTAAIAIQSPNFFGCIEDLESINNATNESDTLLISSFTEPLAFGLYKSPGMSGADIACGEGQSLGITQSFGGPGLGMFATKMSHVRHMPGRVAGETKDKNGNRGYVLTLATREQHIRRSKATSNICTNQGLCALTAAMYMASLGATGFRELAKLNYDKTEYLKTGLKKTGFSIPFNSPTFNEFLVKFPNSFKSTWNKLAGKKIIAGLPVENFYPELKNHYLFCVTEVMKKQDIDLLLDHLQTLV